MMASEMTAMEETMSDESLLARARGLGLNGIVSHWDELDDEARAITARLLGWEEVERAHRSLERRIRDAKLGRFKAIADFDWSHPRRCNRVAIDELFTLKFLDEPANVVLLGPNGIGKTTIAQNVAHKALLDGNTVRSPPPLPCSATSPAATVRWHCSAG